MSSSECSRKYRWGDQAERVLNVNGRRSTLGSKHCLADRPRCRLGLKLSHARAFLADVWPPQPAVSPSALWQLAMVDQTCPGRSPCASRWPGNTCRAADELRRVPPCWRMHDLPNCQTSASADQLHYIRSRHRRSHQSHLHRLDLIDRRTMAAGQGSIDTVAGWCERQRMGPLFRCYTPDDLHGC